MSIFSSAFFTSRSFDAVELIPDLVPPPKRNRRWCWFNSCFMKERFAFPLPKSRDISSYVYNFPAMLASTYQCCSYNNADHVTSLQVLLLELRALQTWNRCFFQKFLPSLFLIHMELKMLAFASYSIHPVGAIQLVTIYITWCWYCSVFVQQITQIAILSSCCFSSLDVMARWRSSAVWSYPQSQYWWDTIVLDFNALQFVQSFRVSQESFE